MAGEDSAPSTSVRSGKKLDRKSKHANDPAEEPKMSKKDKSKSKKDSKSATKENAAEPESGVKDSDAAEPKPRKNKKRRLDDEADADDTNGNDKEDESQQQKKKQKKKNKRVSFSADAKERDGPDTSDDEAMTAANDEDVAPVLESEGNDGDDEGKKKKKKKEKKKKTNAQNQSAGDSNSTTPTTHETPILGYLSLYYKHRSAWKFQKNRETHLFKHILSLEQVPANYNAALLVYLQGLKSEGAKLRLRQVAEEAVKADIEGAESEDKPDNAEEEDEQPTTDVSPYNDAVGAFRKALGKDQKEELDKLEVPDGMEAETVKKLRQRQRGELVLFAVIGALFNYQKPKPLAQKGKKNTVQPGKKKKKNRTAFIEISSSSESESSSDSDSDSDDGKETTAKNKEKDNDSSSDSSSDSDSDSSSSSS